MRAPAPALQALLERCPRCSGVSTIGPTTCAIHVPSVRQMAQRFPLSSCIQRATPTFSQPNVNCSSSHLPPEVDHPPDATPNLQRRTAHSSQLHSSLRPPPKLPIPPAAFHPGRRPLNAPAIYRTHFQPFRLFSMPQHPKIDQPHCQLLFVTKTDSQPSGTISYNSSHCGKPVHQPPQTEATREQNYTVN